MMRNSRATEKVVTMSDDAMAGAAVEEPLLLIVRGDRAAAARLESVNLRQYGAISMAA